MDSGISHRQMDEWICGFQMHDTCAPRGCRGSGLLGGVTPETDCQALSPEIPIQEEVVDSWNSYFILFLKKKKKVFFFFF